MKMILIALVAFASSAGWAQQQVLLIGDSHSAANGGYFGDELIWQLQMSGRYRVERKATIGYSANSWSTRFSQLQSSVKKASIVVVALGTNDADQTKCNSTKAIEKFASQVQPNGQKCFWIGPPNFTRGMVVKSCGSAQKYNQYMDRVKKAVTAKGCQFLDSRKLQSGGQSLTPDERDSTHFKPKLAKDWGRQVGTLLVAKIGSSSNGGSGPRGGQL